MGTATIDDARFVGAPAVYRNSEADPGFQELWLGKYMPLADSPMNVSIDKVDYGLQIQRGILMKNHFSLRPC